jgi:hypothetical protein
MKKLLATTATLLLSTLWAATTCFGQNTTPKFNPYAKENYPKNEKEWAVYVRKTVEPYINDSLVSELFKQADLVFEGIIINSIGNIKTMQAIYELEPYKIFKGNISQDSTIKIISSPAPKNADTVGDWSLSYRSLGIFFVKKQTNGQLEYKFLNPKKSWLLYGSRLLNPIRQEKHLKEVLYNRILALSGAKYEKTSFYHKKKENLDAKNAKSESSTASITAFSRDTVPAGVLSGLSQLTIYSNRSSSVKRDILTESSKQISL